MKNQNYTSHIALHTSQSGITLIALIITIIVMLILVGVTINVALNGGIFSKAEEATTKTKITQIQEALAMKRGEVLADYKGKAPDDYGIELSDLNLPEELKTEYGNKLIISTDGKLYYNTSVVINKGEQDIFEELGIQPYIETPEPEPDPGTSDNFYEFTIAEIMQKGRESSDWTRIIPVEEFWPENVSDELKNNAFDVEFQGAFCASNVTCPNDSRFTNPFAIGGDQNFEKDWTIWVMTVNNEIWISVNTDDSIDGGYLKLDNYIGSEFEDLEITIGLPE